MNSWRDSYEYRIPKGKNPTKQEELHNWFRATFSESLADPERGDMNAYILFKILAPELQLCGTGKTGLDY